MAQHDEMLSAIVDRWQDGKDQISRFTQTGYSFEEWLNWEAFWACDRRGWEASPKPQYRAVHFKDSANQADLMVNLSNDRKLIIECALVHDCTQSH